MDKISLLFAKRLWKVEKFGGTFKIRMFLKKMGKDVYKYKSVKEK